MTWAQASTQFTYCATIYVFSSVSESLWSRKVKAQEEKNIKGEPEFKAQLYRL